MFLLRSLILKYIILISLDTHPTNGHTFQKLSFTECIETYNERSSITFPESTDDHQLNAHDGSIKGNVTYKDENSKISNA